MGLLISGRVYWDFPVRLNTVVRQKTEFFFQLPAGLGHLKLVIIWFHVAIGTGMYLVDRNMQVPVVGISVQRRDTLMITKAYILNNPILDLLQDFFVRLFPLTEGYYKVVGFIVF